MNQSQKLIDLICELDEIGYSQIFGSSARRIALLESIGQTTEILAVPNIARFLLFPSKIAYAASNAIENLMQGGNPEEIQWLEKVSRSSLRLNFDKGWCDLNPKLVKKVPQKVHTLGLLSFHSNGRVRQAAIENLAGLDESDALPYLLLRCNDWVRQVSSIARKIVLRKLETKKMDDFFQHLFFVLKLSDYQRKQNGDILETVLNELTQSDNPDLIKTTLTDPNRFVRRRAFRHLSSSERNIQNSILDVCFNGEDQLLKLKAFKEASKRFLDEELGKLVERFRNDNSVSVRRERLICIVTRFSNEVQIELQLSLFDRSQTIRTFAKYELRKRGVDAFRFYQEALQKGVTVKEAISGLGDSRDKKHADLVKNYLNDSRPKIRRECIKTLSFMFGESETDLFLLHSKDENSKVSSEAIRALTNRVYLVEVTKLRQLYLEETRLGPKVELIRLIDKKGSWEGVPVLVEILGRNDQLATMIEEKLLSRINRVFTKPTEKQKNEIYYHLGTFVSHFSARFEIPFRDWFGKLTRS